MVCSIIFISLAAICNAIMDVCSFHWHKSVFNKLSIRWWNAEISWANKYVNFNVSQGRRKILNSSINYPVQFTDAWHLFKMLMIIFIALSIVFYVPLINWYLDLLIIGIIWNFTFSLFYKHILLKNENAKKK